MSKPKSINDMLTELQKEAESARSLSKYFNMACKDEFGYGVKELHAIVSKYETIERRKREQQASQQGQHNSIPRSE